MQFHFAIIGGGLTATAMLCQFVNRVQAKAIKGRLDPSGIGIQIYEKHDTFGPGFPHSVKFTLPFHIINMCASDMGIIDDNPGDFQDWVLDNSDNLQKHPFFLHDPSSDLKGSRPECNHYPRAVMGEYLQTRFQEALQSAREAGIRVNLYPASDVVDLKQTGNRICLSIIDLSSGKQFSNDADCALLATGHWFEKTDLDRYFTSPWPAKKLRQSIPPDTKIAVIGTSLSAIETLLTLTSDGSFGRSSSGELSFAPSANSRKFVLYSRRGLLPKVRGKMSNRKNRFLNRENLDRLLSENRGNLTLDKIFNLLNSELETAYGQPVDWEEIVNPTGKPADLLQGYLNDAVHGDGPDGELIWQTILHQTFDMVRDVYLNLRLDERKRFDKHYTSVFFTHAATQPTVNAEKLLALMQAGIVEVIKLGKTYQLVKNEDNDYYEFIYRDSRGNLKRDAYRYVVDARGQKKSLKTDPSTLVANLLRRATVLIKEFRPADHPADPNHDVPANPAPAGETYETGSIWIDPETHRVMQMEPENKATKSSVIYAAGAMTRGQIIDASMARGIVQATSRIADDLVDYITRIQQQ